MIELQHVRKEFGDLCPLKDVNVTIHEGDVISVIGPSGTGKSTLLRCINMLSGPTSGSILLDGTEITSPKCDINLVRRKMGMVFQSFNLFGHMTIMENIMAPQIDLLKRSPQEAYDKGVELLKRVGLLEKAKQFPSSLSGGQKQRVAIARTLAMDPEVILFDEPTSALDPTMVGEVEDVIYDLAKTGKTMMIVTHEMRFAREVANRIFYMDEGGVYEDGTPEQIFDNPQKEKTKIFVKHMKQCEIHVTQKTESLSQAMDKLDQFVLKNRISSRMAYRTHAILEEGAAAIFELKKDIDIKIMLEYQMNNSQMQVKFVFDAVKKDPAEGMDVMAKQILQSAAKNMVYEAQENPLPETWIFDVKQDKG